jgi:flagellar biosynthesis/type III secretory pathway protein FliH
LSREELSLPDGARLAAAELLAHGAEATRELLLERARAEGAEAGREEAAAVLDRAVERLSALEVEARAALARAATELALEIARTLLRREIADGNYDLERIVREALGEAAVGRSPCVVHLNPTDHARLSVARFRSGTKLEADEGVARGDVHVETSLGLLVRDLDGALEAIGKRLQEELP